MGTDEVDQWWNDDQAIPLDTGWTIAGLPHPTSDESAGKLTTTTGEDKAKPPDFIET